MRVPYTFKHISFRRKTNGSPWTKELVTCRCYTSVEKARLPRTLLIRDTLSWSTRIKLNKVNLNQVMSLLSRATHDDLQLIYKMGGKRPLGCLGQKSAGDLFLQDCEAWFPCSPYWIGWRFSFKYKWRLIFKSMGKSTGSCKRYLNVLRCGPK